MPIKHQVCAFVKNFFARRKDKIQPPATANWCSGYRVKTANHPASDCWDATVGAAISRPKPFGFQSTPFCRKRAMIEPFRAADSRPYGSNVRCFHGCCSKPIAYIGVCRAVAHNTLPSPLGKVAARRADGRGFQVLFCGKEQETVSQRTSPDLASLGHPPQRGGQACAKHPFAALRGCVSLPLPCVRSFGPPERRRPRWGAGRCSH